MFTEAKLLAPVSRKEWAEERFDFHHHFSPLNRKNSVSLQVLPGTKRQRCPIASCLLSTTTWFLHWCSFHTPKILICTGAKPTHVIKFFSLLPCPWFPSILLIMALAAALEAAGSWHSQQAKQNRCIWAHTTSSPSWQYYLRSLSSSPLIAQSSAVQPHLSERKSGWKGTGRLTK